MAIARVAVPVAANTLFDYWIPEGLPVAAGDIVVLHATAHKPAETRPLAEVKDAIVGRLKNDGARKEARAAADALIAKLKAGAVWDQALSADHHVPTLRQYFARTDQSLPSPLKEALFSAPRPKAGQVEYRGVEVNDGDYTVYAFSAVRDGSPGEAVEKRSGRARELAARFGNGDFAAYAAEAERTADIERNLKAIE